MCPLQASQGDISHAVGLLTAQSAGEDQEARELTAADAHQEAWDDRKGRIPLGKEGGREEEGGVCVDCPSLSAAPPKDDLQTAIALSLQQSQEEQEEERELTRYVPVRPHQVRTGRTLVSVKVSSRVTESCCVPGLWRRVRRTALPG